MMTLKGLELCRAYWEDVGKTAFAGEDELLAHAAVGLVGEGSDCFGYDDDISRDHDWGPGFCLWFTAENYAKYGKRAQELYAAMPEEYKGFRRLRVSENTAGRVGVQELGAFFARYTGLERPPETLHEWRLVPEYGLAALTNGEVFSDPVGELTRYRETLFGYYPEELRRKKLAAACALAGQSGQYNYYRCIRRGETVAAMQALAEFISQSQRIAFLLNRRYAPYYKWTSRALRELPLMGKELDGKYRFLAERMYGRERFIEDIAAVLIREMRRQELSDSGSDFLLHHGECMQSRLTEPELSALPLMAE